MTSTSQFNRLRICAWAGLAVLTALSACSKEDKPAAAAGTTPSPAASPAAEPALPANATPEQRIIAQARAAIGPEAKLTAINSLLMNGKVYDDKNTEVGSVLLLFQKPGKQHTELRNSSQTLIQGSDGIIGWAMNVDANSNRKLSVFEAPQEKQLVYTTMENLYFYRATDLVKGSIVRYEGDVDYRGAKAHKVSFAYPDSITYVRYFDSTTGKLLGTVMLPLGNEVVESGTTTVNGVTFPAVLNNYNKDGKLTQVVKFDKIGINPNIDPKAKIFDLPDMVAMAKSSAAAKAAATSAKPATSTSGAAQPAQAKPTGASGAFPSATSLLKK